MRQNNDDKFLRFNEIEAAIQEVVTPLQGRLLNNVAPFTEINPSLENLGDYFFDEIDAHLQNLDCYLEQLEIGESPTRFFRVTRGE
ncbi:6-carboxytetrahydropterin synthase [Ligilactobacillus saerimneri]|uniref:6-carboxytetrahydropterin synthase n=1 Tax=Ligilactobacillus saerimneri TaxID=228229 RepID=UPI001EE2D70D|nr:6-carboxytetrahydropterin synthase [Ligilactobacillus saerimneri]